jgi:hypothetical protein
LLVVKGRHLATRFTPPVTGSPDLIVAGRQSARIPLLELSAEGAAIRGNARQAAGKTVADKYSSSSSFATI